MGPDTAGRDDRPVSITDRLSGALASRLVMLITASALGMGGGVGWVKTQTEARADPFTGSQGRALEERIRTLEQAQSLDDQHRIDSKGGYERIRGVESQCTDCQARVLSLEGRLQSLEQARNFYHGVRQ